MGELLKHKTIADNLRNPGREILNLVELYIRNSLKKANVRLLNYQKSDEDLIQMI